MTKLFGRVSEISPGSPETWRDRLFLTLDIDWACDEVLADTVSLVEVAGIMATWFVTHDTPLLERLRANSRFELGIHPNFNFLLSGDPRNGANAEEVVDRLLAIVPEARAVRSHSMAQSSPLLQLFADKGLTHDCNHFIPEQAGIELRPWTHWNGLIKAPYFWEDDVYCLNTSCSTIDDLMNRPGLRMFDFHPIHVYLNTEHMDRYESTRPLHRNPHELINHRHQHASGAREFLNKLIGLA